MLVLRVEDPQVDERGERGVEAAVIYAREHGDLRVPFTFRVPAADEQEAEGEGWPASLAGFPLGQWTADARRFYARGGMDEDRVAQLEKLGMIWSHYDVAWEEGLAAARGWAAEHGHLLAPLDATFQGAKVGIFLKNARAAARKAQEIEQRRAEGLPVQSSAGALSDERREQLEEIDASWCPSWPVTWQRCFHLVRMHLDAGEALPTEAGDVVCQGEDLGRWVQSVRLGWDQLTSVQQWMCEQILGIEPASEDEKPKRRTQADKWAMHYQAAKQFYEREGHLQVPRKHVERIAVGEGQEEREHKLGAWIGNQRSRSAALTPERMEQLSAIGMRWS
ncbi:helicase associated domain-containing protein [Streptomyces flavofungini]|uniref:helicase associated domain-containing protein n=1 Tax=Streptomyces flavofungini TaxID=68200 RepID=UPI003F7D32D4